MGAPKLHTSHNDHRQSFEQSKPHNQTTKQPVVDTWLLLKKGDRNIYIYIFIYLFIFAKLADSQIALFWNILNFGHPRRDQNCTRIAVFAYGRLWGPKFYIRNRMNYSKSAVYTAMNVYTSSTWWSCLQQHHQSPILRTFGQNHCAPVAAHQWLPSRSASARVAQLLWTRWWEDGLCLERSSAKAGTKMGAKVTHWICVDGSPS